MVLALAVAVALNSGIDRFRTLFRVGFYTPVVTSIVAVAVVWRFLLQPDNGLLNHGARLGRDRRAQLAPVHHLGDAVADRHGRLAQHGHADGDLPGRPPDHPQGPARAGHGRRGRGLAALPQHHPAPAAADPAVRGRADRRRLPPVLRGAVRDDQGRPLDHTLDRLLRLQPVRLRQLREHPPVRQPAAGPAPGPCPPRPRGRGHLVDRVGVNPRLSNPVAESVYAAAFLARGCARPPAASTPCPGGSPPTTSRSWAGRRRCSTAGSGC